MVAFQIQFQGHASPKVNAQPLRLAITIATVKQLDTNGTYQYSDLSNELVSVGIMESVVIS